MKYSLVLFSPKTFQNCVSTWAYLWIVSLQLSSVSDFFLIRQVLLQSPLSAQITSHLRDDETASKRWPRKHLTHKNVVHATLNTRAHTCIFSLLLLGDILLSSTTFGPLWLRLIFTLRLNCCVFVVASVCPSGCFEEIGAQGSTLNAPKQWLIIAFLSLPRLSAP